MKTLLLFALFIISFNTYATRTFFEVTVPNTTCGDGQPFKIFVSQKGYEKVAFEFMGGGLCWSAKTCKKKNYNKWIAANMIPTLSQMSSDDNEKSPISDHTMVYFPYCTGDVYAGGHQSNFNYYHTGYDNIQKAVQYLQTTNLINFASINDLFVYGWSAGSLGATVHMNIFNNLARADAKKTLILDAPGLHWGNRAWDKLSDQMVADLTVNLQKIGITFNRTEGNVAKQMDKFCNKFSSWKIGVLQGSMDYTMSEKYGEISSEAHKKLVYSKDGILAATVKTDNCKAFVPDTVMHTFMVIPKASKIEVNEVTARDFIFQVYHRDIETNVYDKKLHHIQY